MICPSCGAEYRPGFTMCSDCGVALVDSGAASDGPLEVEASFEAEEDGAALAPLTDSRSSDEIGFLTERLEEVRIPYVIHAGTALALEDGGDLHGVEPDPWEARIWVAGARLAEAKAILVDVRRAMREGA